jgi:endoglucanase
MFVHSSYRQSRHRILFLLSISILGMCSWAVAEGAGYWHTSGNQIIASTGHTVRIAGINWYGFETADQVVHGLWAEDYHTILKAIKNNGYNALRLPYSNQMVETPIVPKNISFANGINTDLKGLNALAVMDKIISAAGALGLRVILDNHRSEAGNSAQANGLWHTSAYPESAWINDWKMLVARYAGYKDASGNPTVVAADLRNEPHLIANGSHTGACWTGDASTGGCPTTNSAQNWPAAAQQAGNAVLSVNPNLLILVEGVDCYSDDCTWWGGNLKGVSTHPITLKVANRLVYSPHDYGPNLYLESWFNSSTTFSSLSSVWNKFWGYISENRIAPVLIGEFGTGNNASDIQNATPGSQGQWFQSLVNFLQNDPALNWTYWALKWGRQLRVARQPIPFDAGQCTEAE